MEPKAKRLYVNLALISFAIIAAILIFEFTVFPEWWIIVIVACSAGLVIIGMWVWVALRQEKEREEKIGKEFKPYKKS